MKAEYTILVPMMLPIHFSLIEDIMRNEGYRLVLLQNTGPAVVETGLKYVHNDTCYPALLVIGQLIDALNSGQYDLNKTALMLTQTGGGCRASNYIHLLRKALVKAGLGDIPVISLNPTGLEKNSGFKLTIPMLRRLLAGVVYGDLLMLLRNQTAPYETEKGAAEALTGRWVEELARLFRLGKALSRREFARYSRQITDSFAEVPVRVVPKVKVGVVGEIYIKYAALGNNNLEAHLTEEEDCEVRVPGLMGFLFYCASNPIEDAKLYGKNRLKGFASSVVLWYMEEFEKVMIASVRRQPRFMPPEPFRETRRSVLGIIGLGNKMGEGWLLTAEMVELIESGVSNIVCTQPFGCLPNHISGKGMIRRLRVLYPEANIVPIDYDPSASPVNQENRIKLMLAIAREQLGVDRRAAGCAV